MLNAVRPEGLNYQWQNGSAGSTYQVTAPGTYWVRIFNGTCYKYDTLTVKVAPAVKRDTTLASICFGQSYALPWGGLVSSAGTFRDTSRYSYGCDSLIRTIQLSVNQAQVQNTSVSICGGNTYTLPWGPIVTQAGIYRDTLRSVMGCDSVIRNLNLAVNSVTQQNTSPVICSGQSYTLPQGSV